MNNRHQSSKATATGVMLAAVAVAVLYPAAAQAQWTDPSGNINSTVTYDGAGVDSGINPHSFTTGDFGIGVGTGNAGVLNVASGTLTINNDGTWGSKIGHNFGTGTVNVSSGATLDWILSGANETALAVGNQDGNGTININGGSLNLSLDPNQTPNASIHGLYLGGWHDTTSPNDATGVLNLYSGMFTWSGAMPTYLGVGQDGVTTMTGTINITDGSFVQTGSSTVDFGTTSDTINFVSGGTGYLSVLGWTQSQFDNLVTAGNITIDGATASPGSFTYSSTGGQGVYQLAAPVPEPGALTLMAVGFGLLLVAKRRRA